MDQVSWRWYAEILQVDTQHKKKKMNVFMSCVLYNCHNCQQICIIFYLKLWHLSIETIWIIKKIWEMIQWYNLYYHGRMEFAFKITTGQQGNLVQCWGKIASWYLTAESCGFKATHWISSMQTNWMTWIYKHPL